MSMSRAHLLAWLADFPLGRRVLESLLAARSRRHLARLDHLPAVRAQYRALQGLIYRARATPFGRDHDFARIRSVEDFRRLVPVRGPAELRRLYSREGSAWPGLALPQAQPHLGVGRLAAPVALSLELLQSQRRALRTALSLALRQRPRMRLLDGKLLWLGDDTRIQRADRDLLDRLTRDRFPLTLSHAAVDASGQDCGRALQMDGCVGPLAARFAGESVSALIGPAERIGYFLDEACHHRGESDPFRIWPHLAAVVCTRRDPATSLDELRTRLGERVPVVELVVRPEAPLGVADPRHEGLRLLVDHGVFFEFLPTGASTGGRLGLESIEPDTPYEVALSSPAGVWAQRTGLVVAFHSLEPPLFRVVSQSAVRGDARLPLPLRPAHRSSEDRWAGPPEMSVRMPWSAPADRG